MSVLDTLARSSRLVRYVEIVVDAGLDARWTRLRNQLEEAAAEDQRSGSLAAENTRRVVDDMEAIRDKVDASRVTFAFEQLDWTRRLALQAEHPPRKNNILDQSRGFNVETYTRAVIPECCLGVIEPDDDTDDTSDPTPVSVPPATWKNLLGDPEDESSRPTFNYAQVNQLYLTATAVNDEAPRVPTSARYLLESLDSVASLQLPRPGTSRRAGSADGSRRGSRKSTATKKAASSR